MISNISDDLIKEKCCYQDGDQIVHRIFGEGIIVEVRFDDFSMRKYRIEEYLLDIDFFTCGRKTLSFNLCLESGSLVLKSKSASLIAS